MLQDLQELRDEWSTPVRRSEDASLRQRKHEVAFIIVGFAERPRRTCGRRDRCPAVTSCTRWRALRGAGRGLNLDPTKCGHGSRTPACTMSCSTSCSPTSNKRGDR